MDANPPCPRSSRAAHLFDSLLRVCFSCSVLVWPFAGVGCGSSSTPSTGEPDSGAIEAGGDAALTDTAAADSSRSDSGRPAPSVRAHVRVTGETGLHAEMPRSFALDKTAVLTLASTFGSKRCDEFWAEPSFSGKELVLSFLPCDPEVYASITSIDLPLIAAAYPAADARLPRVGIQVGPSAAGTKPVVGSYPLQYGSSRAVVGGSLTISEVSGAATGATVSVSHLLAVYEGTLERDTSQCPPGASCATGSATVKVDLELELDNVTTK